MRIRGVVSGLWVVLICVQVLAGPSAVLALRGECGQPVSNGTKPVATDCLFILNASVGIGACDPECICDLDALGGVPTPTDALRCLNVATGVSGVTLNCDCGGDTTSTTTTTTSTTSTTIESTTTTSTTIESTTTTTIDGGSSECPSSVVVTTYAGTGEACLSSADCAVGTCDDTLKRCLTETTLDFGSTGVWHDADVSNRMTIAASLGCSGTGPACGECSIAGIDTTLGSCRCESNNQQPCDQPLQADFDNCGGNACACYLGPPLPLTNLGITGCVVSRLAADVGGTVNVDTGASDWLLSLRSTIFLGISSLQPCPSCDGDATPADGVRSGTCAGGFNDGQSCDADAINESFPAPGGGGSSLDCLPSPGQNISGPGIKIDLTQSTGTQSLAAGVPCGRPPFISAECVCGACSLDSTVACNSNEDCSEAEAGLCQVSDVLFPDSCRNACVDTGDGVTGECDLSGPTDLGCDGIVRANGETIVPCQTNDDCSAFGAGACVLTKQRPCYLPTISVTGSAEPRTPLSASTFCIPPSQTNLVNDSLGLPGPGRVVQRSLTRYTCTGGDYEAGVGCP